MEHYQSLVAMTPIAERAGALASSPVIAEKTYKSAAAARRAVYAERDRKRSLDPGALDFVIYEEDEEEDQEETQQATLLAGPNSEVSVSRRNALEILKIQSEVPPSGMWRSLAN